MSPEPTTAIITESPRSSLSQCCDSAVGAPAAPVFPKSSTLWKWLSASMPARRATDSSISPLAW